MAEDRLRLNGKKWRFLDYPDAYCRETQGRKRPLELEPARRQIRTADSILNRLAGLGVEQVGGVLLADDVGLGKTTIAALVAWVVAGSGGRVRIFAPNAVLRRRWADELEAHVLPLQRRASGLEVSSAQIKYEDVGRLRAGRIQVGTHNQLVRSHVARERRTECDLMIIDEAHRAKGEGCGFNKALKDQGHLAKAKLILTATPFSIAISELVQLLGFVGAPGETTLKVERYARALDKLHQLGTHGHAQTESKKLVTAARGALEAIAPYVIRHGIDDLPAEERKHFGEVAELSWGLRVPAATEEELELLLRADRLFKLVNKDGGGRTNDPRFHVGWRHLDQETRRVEEEAPEDAGARLHLARIRARRRAQGRSAHAKVTAVAGAIREKVDAGEKVVAFCHHRATALELLETLDRELRLPAATVPGPKRGVWEIAWSAVLQEVFAREAASSALLPGVGGPPRETALLDNFVDWLCSPGLRRQVAGWLAEVPDDAPALAERLRRTRVRHRSERSVPSIAAAARTLFLSISDSQSRSTVGFLREVGRGSEWPGRLDDGYRAMGSWYPDSTEGIPPTLYTGSADIVLAVFNSPFGPDVLVATDRLSEGVDLHRCCRHLVHYELDPSPARTLQRNGRIRRVGGWAALTGQPLEYAYPAFGGTRDARAVEIMKIRLQCFDLLLGGVPRVDPGEEDVEQRQSFVGQVLALARHDLERSNGLLTVPEPSGSSASAEQG